MCSDGVEAGVFVLPGGGGDPDASLARRVLVLRDKLDRPATALRDRRVVLQEVTANRQVRGQRSG